MTGYESKRAAAQDKLDNDDLTIAYQSGYYDGKKAAQPAQEPIKPVAWLEPEWGEKICPEVGYEVTMTDDHPRDLCWIPLVAQRPWVGLTYEDMVGLQKELFDKNGEMVLPTTLAMAVEAKLKEKNT